MSSLRSFARAAAIAAAAALPSAEFAFAQGAPVHVRGEIVKLEGDMLHVKDRQGQPVTVKLAPNFGVSEVRKADLADIKPGTYVGTAGVPQPDGTLKAIEVLIFPDAMKGVGEGHRLWDLAPQSTMTNATVDGVATAGAGRTLKLKYKDGEKTVVVPPEAPIVTLGPGTPAMLKPGAHIFIGAATKAADGSLAAARIAVGKDGLVPPM